MMTNMIQIPAMTTPAFGTSTCGQPSFVRNVSALTLGEVAIFAGVNGAGKRGYAAHRGSHAWSPPSR